IKKSWHASCFSRCDLATKTSRGNNMFKRLVIALFGLMAAGAVHAVPFEIDGANSSVNSAGITLCGSCSFSTTFSPTLDLTSFDLNEGGSETFDFFSISASNGGLLASGAIGGVLSATL